MILNILIEGPPVCTVGIIQNISMYLCIKILSVHLILCTNGTTKTECWVNPYLHKDLMLRYNGLSLSKNTQQSAGKLMPHIGCPCGVPPIQACLLKTECMKLPWSQSLTLRMPYSYHNLSGRVPRLSPIILRDFWGLRAVHWATHTRINIQVDGLAGSIK